MKKNTIFNIFIILKNTTIISCQPNIINNVSNDVKFMALHCG